MKKYIYITQFFILLSVSNVPLFCQEAEFPIDYPTLDMTVGPGFLWLIQTNLSYTPIEYLYIQPRISATPVVAYEFGGVIGYQVKHGDLKLVRIGIGYSQGDVFHSYVDDSEDNSEIYKSVYIRLDLLYKLNKQILFNPNVNITRFSERPIYSVNFCLGYCIIE